MTTNKKADMRTFNELMADQIADENLAAQIEARHASRLAEILENLNTLRFAAELLDEHGEALAVELDEAGVSGDLGTIVGEVLIRHMARNNTTLFMQVSPTVVRALLAAFDVADLALVTVDTNPAGVREAVAALNEAAGA